MIMGCPYNCQGRKHHRGHPKRVQSRFVGSNPLHTTASTDQCCRIPTAHNILDLVRMLSKYIHPRWNYRPYVSPLQSHTDQLLPQVRKGGCIFWPFKQSPRTGTFVTCPSLWIYTCCSHNAVLSQLASHHLVLGFPIINLWVGKGNMLMWYACELS